MGVSYYAYAGVFLKFEPSKTVDIKSKIHGCQKCKTESSGNFCTKCGSKHEEWERVKKEKYQCGYEFFNHALKSFDEEIYDDMTDVLTGLEYAPCIISCESEFGKHLYNNDAEYEIVDWKKIPKMIEVFEVKNKEIIEKLKEAGFEFEIVYGTIAYAS